MYFFQSNQGGSFNNDTIPPNCLQICFFPQLEKKVSNVLRIITSSLERVQLELADRRLLNTWKWEKDARGSWPWWQTTQISASSRVSAALFPLFYQSSHSSLLGLCLPCPHPPILLPSPHPQSKGWGSLLIRRKGAVHKVWANIGFDSGFLDSNNDSSPLFTCSQSTFLTIVHAIIIMDYRTCVWRGGSLVGFMLCRSVFLLAIWDCLWIGVPLGISLHVLRCFCFVIEGSEIPFPT